MRSVVLAAALGLAAVSPCAGQSTPAAATPPLTLERAVALARTRHPLLAAASGRRTAAAGRARQDAAWANPVVEWREENLGSPLQHDVFATVTVPVDLTGRRLARRAAGAALVRRAEADSVAVAREVEAGAARAFWRAALASSLVTVAQEQREAMHALADFDADRLRHGAVAEAVAIRTRLEAHRARVAESGARTEWEGARAALARALGVPPDSLPPLSALPVARAATFGAPPPLDSAVALAVARRPELAAMRAAADAARQRVGAERRGVLADASLVAGTKRTGGYDTRVVGAALPLPLFDRNGGARQAAAGELLAIEAELRDLENRVRAEVAATVNGYVAVLAAGPDVSASLAAGASEVATIAQAAYREGGASLLEVLEARRTRAEVHATALRWAVTALEARLDLNRATGAPPLESLESP
jgi:outer membrane protein, heavy metal efflux system